jgi:hypothetical protein
METAKNSEDGEQTVTEHSRQAQPEGNPAPHLRIVGGGVGTSYVAKLQLRVDLGSVNDRWNAGRKAAKDRGQDCKYQVIGNAGRTGGNDNAGRL